MSKYRFKTKEEFFRDGLWNDKYNCPEEWVCRGLMNKYLGMDIPNELNIYCNKKKDFAYDGWYFRRYDYVLKEQQKYFDDLSQHIGRYIRALVDNPHAGSGVKKGDIGKIITNCQADFPNCKAYNCTCALNKNNLGIRYELLPEDYSPEQEVKEPNIEFIPGKWYKWYQKDHQSYHYGKVKEINLETDTLVVIPWIIQCADYTYSGTFNLSKAEQIQEISVEDIQEFLPIAHPDKFSKSSSDKVEYEKQKSHIPEYIGSCETIEERLTLEEKTNYLRIGMGLAGLPTNNMTAELIVKLYEGILKKGGSFNLEDAVKLEVEVTGKYTQKEVKAEPADGVPA